MNWLKNFFRTVSALQRIAFFSLLVGFNHTSFVRRRLDRASLDPTLILQTLRFHYISLKTCYKAPVFSFMHNAGEKNAKIMGSLFQISELPSSTLQLVIDLFQVLMHFVIDCSRRFSFTEILSDFSDYLSTPIYSLVTMRTVR